MKTKFAIIVPDGAADDPLEIFDDKSVLDAADIPNMDRISKQGRQGIVQTVPPSMTPGSDVAQMSLLGYDPLRYYTGRAPIEAVAMNISLKPSDWVFRCNLVTIADGVMDDHSAGHISTEEARTLIDELRQALADEQRLKLYSGVSYRHLCVFSDIEFDVDTVPPHDIIGQKAEKNMPKGRNADILNDIMARSRQLFANNEINRVRNDLGENPVSSVWLWGQGQKAMLENFHKRFGVRGAAITAVDLVRGLAKLIGFDIINVPGATGYLDTDYAAKGKAAVEALKEYDLIFVHVEAPDEAGHSGNAAAKKLAVEQIDKHIVGPVHAALKEYDSYRILVLPDHPTPVETRNHTDEPVPFAMAGKGITGILDKGYCEVNSYESGFRIERGCDLMEYFLSV